MDGWITIGTELDTKSFDKQIIALEDKLDTLEQERDVIASQKTISESDLELLKKYESEIEKTSNQIIGLRKRQEEIANQNVFGGIDFNLSSILKKVSKWALALFSIRGAYSLITRSMSTLSQQDENLANQLEYIRWAIAQAIAPVVKWIINAVYTIMGLINSITQALFGWDLFKGPKEFASSMNKASKSAKDIKKSLAGFDEMNILGDNTSSGGGGGTKTPEFDKIEIPEFPQWAKELAFWLGVAYASAVLLSNLASTMLGLGIGLAIGGLIMLISDVVDFIKDPSWKNFIKILTDIGVAIGGIMIIMGNWWGLLVSIIALLVRLVVENWDTIMKTLSKVGGWINDHIVKPIANFFKGLWNGIISGVNWAVQMVKNAFSGTINFFSSITSKIVNLFKKIGTKVGDVIGGAFKAVINGVLKAIEKILNAPIKAINKLINKINDVPGINLKKLDTLKLPRLARGTILNNPGRGVPIGGAIAGEAGREAVLPLSDSRLLEELGSTIGRYITINLTNETKLDGRTIARKVSQLNNNENFLRNR